MHVVCNHSIVSHRAASYVILRLISYTVYTPAPLGSFAVVPLHHLPSIPPVECWLLRARGQEKAWRPDGEAPEERDDLARNYMQTKVHHCEARASIRARGGWPRPAAPALMLERLRAA